MIFLVQFGINKHLQIFQRLQIARVLRAHAIFCSLWNICLPFLTLKKLFKVDIFTLNLEETDSWNISQEFSKKNQPK